MVSCGRGVNSIYQIREGEEVFSNEVDIRAKVEELYIKLFVEPYARGLTVDGLNFPPIFCSSVACMERPFSEEVKVVVWELEGDKASSPNGFPIDFYKICWEVVKRLDEGDD